jgi:hypothetical protein
VPLSQAAFISSIEPNKRPDAIAYFCHNCLTHLYSDRLHPQALLNGLWTGANEVPALSDLAFIEEKLIARVHVSISLVCSHKAVRVVVPI